eukprot:9392025-Ditylum_brightwellii.AAC.1
MYTGSKKWGPHHDRVEAYVVNIQCVAEDALYTKTLLSATYEQQLISIGAFIPQGLFRITGEEAYKYHLRAHNKYISSTTLVAIVGMHCNAMEAQIVIDGGKMALEHYINNVNSTIDLVQETNKTDEEGKWLLVCTKADTPRVIRFVDFVHPTIFEEHITEVEK